MLVYPEEMLELKGSIRVADGNSSPLTDLSGPAAPGQLAVVEQKLIRVISNPDYGIRFVNLGEYLQILRDQRMDAREATLFRPSTDSREMSLSQYLGLKSPDSSSSALGGWVSAISLQTETALHYSRNIKVFAKFRAMLSAAHLEAIQQSHEAVSERTRKRFAELLREDYQARDTRYLSGMSPYHFLEKSIYQGKKYLAEHSQESAQPEQKRLLDSIRAEYEARESALQLLKAVGSGQHHTISASELRTLFLALGFAGWEHPIKAEGLNWRQYHIALVFDADALTQEPSWGVGGLVRGWRILRSGKEFDAQNLLAAVALIPEKKLWEIMKSHDQHAGQFAHPIFNHRGQVLYPQLATLPSNLIQALA